MEIKFLHLLGHHRNLIDLLSSKMDKIHETTVSRHWTTDSPRLIPEKETNKVSPHCPSSLPSQGRELKESLVVLEGEERERESVCARSGDQISRGVPAVWLSADLRTCVTNLLRPRRNTGEK